MEERKNVVYNAAGQMLDVYLPQGEFQKVFLFFHGGGLSGGDRGFQPFMGYLREKGMAVVSAAYRLYPDARFPDYVEDAADAAAWVKENFPNKRLYVGGSSAGGYLSMMLCFDESFLRRRGLRVSDIQGFVHDAGQPTTHFAVLQERGLDSRRIVVDKAAPMYHIRPNGEYPPMLFLVSEEDIPCRLEQTKLMLEAMAYLGCGDCARLQVLPGLHVSHDNAFDSQGESVFGKLILELTEKGVEDHA